LMLGVAVLGSGCATRRQVAEANLQINQIRKEHSQIRATLMHIDSLLVEQTNAQNRLNAEMKMSMGAIEERMLLVEQRMEDIVSLVNQRVPRGEQGRPRPPEGGSSDTTKASGQVDQLKLYQLAYGDLTNGRYDMAIKGFQELLKEYPNSTLADNAVYWIAECYYIQNTFADAQKWYEKLIKDYPQSEHIAQAKYKLGMSLYKQRYQTKAKQYFQDVVKDYPGTEEASRAAEMLKQY
jgi:tol-pal system protein YbgF